MEILNSSKVEDRKEIKKEVEQKVEQTKLSYEQLNEVCTNLSNQNRQLYTKLQEANSFNYYKRLEYLFKVIENYSNFPQEFVDSCTNEIISMMQPDTKEASDGEGTKEV